jgi:hypothetical protein
MVLVTSSFANDPAVTGSAFFLCVAGGFAAVWLLGLLALPRETHPWPLVPATILGIMGLAVVTRTPGAIDWLTAGIAVALITGGIAMVVRHRRGETVG